MKPMNVLFYLLVFIGFFLPTNSKMYVPLPGILLQVNEIAFLLLPIVNLFCYSHYKKLKINKKIINNVNLFLFFVIVNEFVFKPIVFGQSFGDSFKSFRLGIPLISSLILLKQGINVNPKVLWKVLLYAIGISIILSILSIFVSLPIYYNMNDADVLETFKGRIMNANAPFGIIGFYLMFKDKDKWYNQGKLVKVVSVLSVIALVITFNRTYLALLVIMFFYLSYKTFSRRTFIKLIIYPLILIGVSWISYINFSIVKRQIDRRILSIVFKETTLVESTISDNRDKIYQGMLDRVEEGYWIIGMPYDTHIFRKSVYRNSRNETLKMTITDTSLVNILLRFGFIPFLIFIIIYYRLFKLKQANIVLFVFLIASLNTDALMRQNSIFFLIIFLININIILNVKNSIYSQNRFEY